MRRSAEELHAFYDGPLGRAVLQAVRPQVALAWGGAAGLDVLGLGYAAPFLADMTDARRRIAAMPGAMGAHAWPPFARNAAVLVGEARLPFANALFDRIVAAHLLEEAEAPHAWLVEAARVLAPAGRLMCVTACRSGAWARAERTPFGHGRPYSRTQLFAALRTAGLEPQASARVLHVPPHRAFVGLAGLFEAAGGAARSPLCGLVMVEAVKRTFAVRPSGLAARARARPALVPARAAVGVPARREPAAQAWPDDASGP